MQKLSTALEGTNSTANLQGNISNTPVHGLTQEGGKMNTQLPQVNQMQKTEIGLHVCQERILNSTKYDWTDNCIFDEEGNVISFKRQNITNDYSLKPVPNDIYDLKGALETIEEQLKPITLEQVAFELSTLLLQCGKTNISKEQLLGLAESHLNILGVFPYKMFKLACRRYLSSSERVYNLPTTGELTELVKYDLDKLQRFHSRLTKINNKN